MATRNLRVTVDHDLCIGNAMCREAAPDTFFEQSTGQSVANNPPGDDSDALFEAAETCPVAAIRIQDTETGHTLTS